MEQSKVCELYNKWLSLRSQTDEVEKELWHATPDSIALEAFKTFNFSEGLHAFIRNDDQWSQGRRLLNEQDIASVTEAMKLVKSLMDCDYSMVVFKVANGVVTDVSLRFKPW